MYAPVVDVFFFFLIVFLSSVLFARYRIQDMYEQLRMVRDKQEAGNSPFGVPSGGRNPDNPRIILVSRRLPYKLQVIFQAPRDRG